MSTLKVTLLDAALRAGEMQEATVRTPRATAQTMQTLQQNNRDRENYNARMRGHMPLNRLPGAWQEWGEHHSRQLLQVLQRSNTKWAYPLELIVDEEHKFTMIWTGGAKVVMKVGDQILAYLMEYEQPTYDCTYCINLREWLPDWALLKDSLEGATVTLGHRWDYYQALNQLVTEACRIIKVKLIPNQFVRREIWLLQQGPQPDPTDAAEVAAFQDESQLRLAAAQERSTKYRKAKWTHMKRWRKRQQNKRKEEDNEDTNEEVERDDREPHPDRQTLCHEATTSAEGSGQLVSELEGIPDRDVEHLKAEEVSTKPNLERQTLCLTATPSVGRVGQSAMEVKEGAGLDQRSEDDCDELPELDEEWLGERRTGEPSRTGATRTRLRVAGSQQDVGRKRKRDIGRVTTATSWEPGSYIAPQHLYTVAAELDRSRVYEEGERVACAGDLHSRWKVAKVLQKTDNLGFLVLDQGGGQWQRTLHTQVRGLQIGCTRIPGDIVGPPDMLLIREHQEEHEHEAGDTVVFCDVRNGVPLFRYAKVEELDMNDKDAAPGMFQLHGGEENFKMIRARATFFRLDLTSERREAAARETGPQRTCWRCPEQQHQVMSSERVERTTTEGWFAGHYVDPAHEHMVESAWDLMHEYGRYEKAALQIQHPKYNYLVVEMAIAPVGTTPMEWRTVYRGPGQPATKESPQRLRVVRRPDSRIPGDPLVKDRELGSCVAIVWTPSTA